MTPSAPGTCNHNPDRNDACTGIADGSRETRKATIVMTTAPNGPNRPTSAPRVNNTDDEGTPTASIAISDVFGPEHHERDGDELLNRKLHIDAAPWAHHVFTLDRNRRKRVLGCRSG